MRDNIQYGKSVAVNNTLGILCSFNENGTFYPMFIKRNDITLCLVLFENYTSQYIEETDIAYCCHLYIENDS